MNGLKAGNNSPFSPSHLYFRHTIITYIMFAYSAVFSFFMGASCLLMACQPSGTAADQAPASSQSVEASQPAEGADPTITERGRITQAEDAGYPIMVVTIEFPERNFSEQFTVNLEEVEGMDGAALSAAVGKYVVFDYTSVLSNALLDLKYNGKSLIYESDAPEMGSDIQTIEGILSNAAEETTSDLPDELLITTEEEITERFEFYITSEIVKANGKRVVGYYESRTQNTIHRIELIK